MALALVLAGAVVTLAFSAGGAQAEVRGVGEFMPPSWRGDDRAASSPNARTSRAATRRSAARRAVAADSDDEADTPATTPRQRRAKRQRRVRVASLGSVPNVIRAPRPSLSGGGGGVTWRASAGCLASNLRAAVAYVAANYGGLTVASTCRSKRHNRRVGGATRSHHLTGNAVDFRMRGNVGAAYAYLRSVVGGIKHYGGGRFHIDNGPRRTF